MSKWLKRGGHGAIWLLTATLLTKLIGVLQKIPLQNLGGDAVFGIYNMIYPLYQLMLILAVSGIPTAISAIIAESEHRHRGVILQSSNILMIIIGLLFGLLTYSCAGYIAALIGDVALTSMVKIIAITICIAPILASFRGYYQGIKLASYSSVSQLIEQMIRVAIMVIVLYIGVQQQWSDTSLATYVLWGGVVGAAIALCYLIGVKQHEAHTVQPKQALATYLYYMRQLLIKGLPAALAAVIVPLVAVIDTFTIPVLLSDVASFEHIAEQFGLYSRIQPLVQLVTMLLAAVIAGVLPDLILSSTTEQASLHRRLSLILRYTIIIGSAATIGLILLAEPVSIMLYKNTLGVQWFRLLSLMTLPAALLAVVTPLLLIQRRIMLLCLLVIVALLSKIGLNIFFMAKYETMLGAVYATLLCLYITAAIALLSAWIYSARAYPLRVSIKVASQSCLALLVMATYLGCARFIAEHIIGLHGENRFVIVCYVIALVLTGALILIATLNKLKVLSKQDIKQMISK